MLTTCLPGGALLLALLSWPAPAPANQPTYTIHLSARQGGTNNAFRLQLTRFPRRVRILYGRYDSTARALDRNPEYQELLRAFSGDRPFTKAEFGQKARRMAQLSAAHERYSLDSLEVSESQHPAFLHLLDSVYQSSTAVLEHKPQNHIWLDGHSVRVQLSGPGQPDRELYVPNPVPPTLIYRLLHGSFELYRPRQPNLFATRRATLGY